MSFREQRAFIEKMRTLGYPKLISMESFRSPNFNLVADILLWLTKSYDPNIHLLDDIGTEKERVAFIKSIATCLVQKANIKINTRKVYAADGNAVQEMLKIASVLYDAKNTKFTEDEMSNAPLDVSGKLSQLKVCRQLATVITEKGASLYDLLGKELDLRDIRGAVISRPFDLGEMGAAVNELIKQIRDQSTNIQSTLENLSSDEATLLGKIEKKKIELERAEKRLKSLQVVRPAYMDEYERIEQDLSKVYEKYMEKYRNLTYLEQQLEDHCKMEKDKFEETEITLRRMQNRLRDEEIRMLRGDKEISAAGNAFGSKSNRRRLNAVLKGSSSASSGSKNSDDSSNDDDDNEFNEEMGEEDDSRGQLDGEFMEEDDEEEDIIINDGKSSGSEEDDDEEEEEEDGSDDNDF